MCTQFTGRAIMHRCQEPAR